MVIEVRMTSFVGFRAQEMASLSPASFRLDGDAPTVTVEAAYSKHKWHDVQPTRADLALLLSDWMDGKSADATSTDGPYTNG